MLIRTSPPVEGHMSENEVTPLSRRQIMTLGAATFLGGASLAESVNAKSVTGTLIYAKPTAAFTNSESLTPLNMIKNYTNFYEFGTDKTDPAKYAEALTTRPWAVAVGGLCDKPKTYDIETLMKNALQERIYRLRCVEGWSMNIPWVGFPLSVLIKAASPTAKAKYVAFESINRPGEMRGQRSKVLQWPYREGLRLDEALNPVAFLAVGLYGNLLPNSEGAPIRLLVPWKYGFKSIKSIAKITFTEKQPPTAWNTYAPSEYGFYSNVNPTVDHPRWSQARERRINEFSKKPTLMFNGYGPQVAAMYRHMDLKVFF
jgi:methionine sulfoxide reductase catalytic subunit